MLTIDDISRIGHKTTLLLMLTPISANATMDRMMALVNGGLAYEEAVDQLIEEFSGKAATNKEKNHVE